MTTSTHSTQAPEAPHFSDETPDSQAITPPKAPYETPQLVTYGRLRHLTLQNISGGGDDGDI